jgi:hypothetical protein
MRETLLDLLWYETVIGRLSPEMEAILTCHLSACRVCGPPERSHLAEVRCGAMDSAAIIALGSEPGSLVAR